MARPQNRNT